ncbi:AtpZ/AtpI family protein [Nitratireductor sp. GCM10026969]|uniref:AtpZ/AtpI family protein n=1 Tax=Nitratireductor sp. GCM10026969 TaxID=3252645 RepID=UPI0036162D54
MEGTVADRDKPGDLDGRRRTLEAALAARKPAEPESDERAKTGGAGGFANALRLSSEFIAGIVVGAALGWFIDEMAGTSPWGLIIFLLLGFGAGIVNVLRSAGQVADFGATPPKKGDDEDGKD